MTYRFSEQNVIIWRLHREPWLINLSTWQLNAERSEKISEIMNLGEDILEKDLLKTEQQKARVRLSSSVRVLKLWKYVLGSYWSRGRDGFRDDLLGSGDATATPSIYIVVL